MMHKNHDLSRKKNFDVFIQEIHSRQCISKSIKDISSKRCIDSCAESVNGLELFFRPKFISNVELYYDNISNDKRVHIGYSSFLWLYENIEFLNMKYNDIDFISINLELSSISKLKNEMIIVSEKLKDLSISLIVEITERNRFFSKSILYDIFDAYDNGVKFAIDDISIIESRLQIFDLSIFDFIKIKITDYFTMPNRQLFLDRMFSGNKEVIIEDVESYEDVKKLKIEPIRLFQGYFFCRPKKVDNIFI